MPLDNAMELNMLHKLIFSVRSIKYSYWYPLVVRLPNPLHYYSYKLILIVLKVVPLSVSMKHSQISLIYPF